NGKILTFDVGTKTLTALAASEDIQQIEAATLSNGNLLLISPDKAYLYDDLKQTLIPVPSPPKKISRHHMVVRKDGSVWILGGKESNEKEKPTSTVQVFDPKSMTWSFGKSLLKGQMYGTSNSRLGTFTFEDGNVLSVGISQFPKTRTDGPDLLSRTILCP
ncbi:MAG: hypothetical protein EBU49_14500, partial [Proteobacteria bacterium]|nr:hypothetical protein [Pseudomonadota bacterium]